MLNTEARNILLQVADAIEASDRLELGHWVSQENNWDMDAPELIESGALWNSCNTTGCIAGWVAATQEATADQIRDAGGFVEYTQKVLSITHDQADNLTLGTGVHEDGVDVWGKVRDIHEAETGTMAGWAQDAKATAIVLRAVAHGVVSL